MNGFTLNNYVLRDNIINYIDCEVYFVSESHLKEGEKFILRIIHGMVNLEK